MTPKGAIPLVSRAGYGIPHDLIVPLTTVAFAGRYLPAHAQPGAYLSPIYGDWRTVRYPYMDASVAVRRLRLGIKSEPAGE